jgi:hypothetical protein
MILNIDGELFKAHIPNRLADNITISTKDKKQISILQKWIATTIYPSKKKDYVKDCVYCDTILKLKLVNCFIQNYSYTYGQTGINVNITFDTKTDLK